MTKLYDKDDPNQVKEDQSPYGAEASDDPSPAAMHGRVVRLETNAQHVATKEGMARVEGKVDEAKAELKGEIKSGNAKLDGKIDTNKAQTDAKIEWLAKLLYVSIGMQFIDFAKDSPIIASIVSFITKLFR